MAYDSRIENLEKMTASLINNQIRDTNYTKADIEGCKASDADIIKNTNTSINELELALEEVYEMIQ